MFAGHLAYILQQGLHGNHIFTLKTCRSSTGTQEQIHDSQLISGIDLRPKDIPSQLLSWFWNASDDDVGEGVR